MDIRESLRQYQQDSIAKRQAELEKSQQEHEEYLQSEQYQKDCWEHNQDLWEQKAKKEGWHYTRQKFISAYERDQQAKKTKQEEIAFLGAKLKTLKGED
jgi:hypothetical protein